MFHSNQPLVIRHAACLVFALKGRTDRQVQDDVAYVAGELDLDDSEQLDVFAALDDLCTAREELHIAIHG